MKKSDSDYFIEGLKKGDRGILARAITLLEGKRSDQKLLSQEVIQKALPLAGESLRLGISGAPGVGKSTFIERLGKHLTGKGFKVAVLAVDPSGVISGGSILGDKTRMEELAADPQAFIRPTPSGGKLGGVAAKTRDTMTLCEAAGFNIVLVESVGVGQSEIALAGMVDFFLLLMQPGAGDDLQSMKKGILELADLIAVNKAEGENQQRAELTRLDYSSSWSRSVVTCSALTGLGIEEIWQQIESFLQENKLQGSFAAKRSRQNIQGMRDLLDEKLWDIFLENPLLKTELKKLEGEVAEGKISGQKASEQIFQKFLNNFSVPSS